MIASSVRVVDAIMEAAVKATRTDDTHKRPQRDEEEEGYVKNSKHIHTYRQTYTYIEIEQKERESRGRKEINEHNQRNGTILPWREIEK